MTVLGRDDIERSVSRGEIGARRGEGQKLQIEPTAEVVDRLIPRMNFKA